MFFIFKQIKKIISEGFDSMKTNIDGNPTSSFQYIFFIMFLPIVILVIGIFKGFNIEGTLDPLLNVLSIFSSLIFGIIFIVPEKLAQRMESLEKEKNEYTKNYLIRFTNFTKKFIQQMLFIMILCLTLLVLLIVFKNTGYYKLKYAISYLSCPLFYYLLLFILGTISNISILLMDDITNIKNRL